ncbi:hypothetical protein BaRGS_00031688 [Batillaria attramentaria]|uniref:Uncharacterized protein n=1 Tax=Batillaria attramentaria TaxID=370345 RepID=A0ABD0JQG4_9CAEN
MHNGYHDQEAPCLLPSRPESFYIPISQVKAADGSSRNHDNGRLFHILAASIPWTCRAITQRGCLTRPPVKRFSGGQETLQAYAHRVLSGNWMNGMGRQAMSRHRR